MPFNYNRTDHSPLCTEVEIVIRDMDKLVQHVGMLMLGHHRYIETILAAKHGTGPPSTDRMIDRAQKQLSIPLIENRHRRDGWLFQLMTWNSLRMEHTGVDILANAPHTNSGQHGIDGLGIVLDSGNRIKTIFIAEDKYTEKPRPTIYEDVWPEFKLFEEGEFDAILTSNISSLLRHLSDDEVAVVLAQDITLNTNRVYRAGITPLPNRSVPKHRKKLFKDFDKCVTGANHLRRQGVTFSQPDIRKFMDDFSLALSDFLETQRP